MTEQKRFEKGTNKDYRLILWDEEKSDWLSLDDVEDLANEQDQKIENILSELLKLDNTDNWTYDRLKYTIQEIAKIVGYHGGI